MLRTLYVFCTLALCTCLWLPPAARAQSTDLQGTFQPIADQNADIEAAIETAIAKMNFVKRPFARNRLKKTNTAYQRIHIARLTDAVELTFDQRKPLRVLFLLNPGGNQPMVAGRHTAADAMLTYAGATNAIQDFAGYRALSPEALAACQPDVVLTTDDTLQASGGKQNLLAGAGFQLTPAGRNGCVVSLDTLFLLGFGPRLPDAVAELHRRLFTS